jgi:NAD(P)-dependent dehydrogenase (short-subunit alcohol dehydrogenase family)
MAEAAGVEVKLVLLDVGDDASVRSGLDQVLQGAGRVDNLVNNAGVGGNAVTEECPVSLYADVMNVNFYGAVRCIQGVLPQMRSRRSGCIVNISSVVGRVAALGQQPYVASKWALEGMSEGLAQELAPYGIRVAIVEPGITKSAIFAKNVDAPHQTGAYEAHYRRLFQFYAVGIAQATDPFEVGAVVDEAITSQHPRLRYAVSWGAQDLIEGRRALADEDWVALGAHTADQAYYDAFERHFKLHIHP